MSENLLHLSKDFAVPVSDYASQGNAILGIRDAGKTYTAMKAAEELMDSGVPIIVYDPIGVWKNLKIGTGKNKGYQVVVAGGTGSDIVLNTTNAVDIVRAAMKENVNLVIDLYHPDLINKSGWIKIVQETVDVLMYENKSYSMRHIFLEEAAEYIPQRLQPQQNRVYASIERLARMGRNARLGYTLINQRAEEINKAILEISNFSLLHKQVGKNSLKSIQQWLELRQLDNAKDIIKSLPTLQQGECWAIGLTDQPKRIQIAERKTFHPNPRKDQGHAITMRVTDVSAFVSKMNEQLEKEKEAKAPKKKDVASEKKSAEQSAVAGMIEQVSAVRNEMQQWKNLAIKRGQVIDKIHLLANSALNETAGVPAKSPSYVKQNPSHVSPAENIPQKNGPTVTGGAMRMLKAACMFYPGLITRTRMALLAEISPTSGSFSTYLATLKRDGLLTSDGFGFCATQKGVDTAGHIEPLPTDPKALIEMWCSKVGPQSGCARILRVLGDSYPEELSRHELAEQVEMSHTSGSFSTYLSTLKRNALITASGGRVKAADELFK